MTRPSANIDSLLLKTGEELIIKNGFEKFSIREVCKTTNVNLGMFHYCFKTKENFISIIFKNFHKKYDDIQQKYLLENKEKKAIEKIRDLLFIRAKFGRINKEIFLLVLKDSFIVKFKNLIEDYNNKQFKMFEKLVKDAQKQGDISKKIAVIYALPLLLSPINLVSFADRKTIEEYKNSADAEMKKLNFENYTKKLIDIVLGGLK